MPSLPTTLPPAPPNIVHNTAADSSYLCAFTSPRVPSPRQPGRYFLAGAGNWCKVALLLLAFVLAEASYISVDSWLAVWAKDMLDKDLWW